MTRPASVGIYDGPISTILICLGVIAALVWLGRIAVDVIRECKTEEPEPQPKPESVMCQCCRKYRARTVARTHTDEIRRVCFGCLDEGYVREWWAA